MKLTAFTLIFVASSFTATAQTPAKPATPATPVHHAAVAASATKLPAGVPPVKGIIKPAFTLRYEDYKVGTGADAEPNKLYKVFYTGYLGSNGRPDDGHKFDSSDDHRQPLKGDDGKPVMGPDGKPKMGDPQPMTFPQGMGRLIPGFDQGFTGMKVGGKRRLFIPWQLAYGAHGRPGPDAAHPGIPPKSDLIFDVELVNVSDMPTPTARPGMGGALPGVRPMPPGAVPHPAAPPATSAPGTSPSASPAPATPATTPTPSTPPPSAPATPPSH
jgi:peptidylprolyl isomerase